MDGRATISEKPTRQRRCLRCDRRFRAARNQHLCKDCRELARGADVLYGDASRFSTRGWTHVGPD
jgi:hypothetical protein